MVMSSNSARERGLHDDTRFTFKGQPDSAGCLVRFIDR
ncbi:MAG: hypothetical protein OZSIB_4306 [Candidatus Ozemobacter sibiricus]|uniref:Uncharacterized protein n=1 Tax=Candidatus Ozemobacter sibiricus TaxID=2268124 RepID=A0A367ZQA2_9BACT|nr:MAG: hypothetical protein OZSIB_4306 [Candidatus Ozemobacter sibiricus]